MLIKTSWHLFFSPSVHTCTSKQRCFWVSWCLSSAWIHRLDLLLIVLSLSLRQSAFSEHGQGKHKMVGEMSVGFSTSNNIHLECGSVILFNLFSKSVLNINLAPIGGIQWLDFSYWVDFSCSALTPSQSPSCSSFLNRLTYSF